MKKIYFQRWRVADYKKAVFGDFKHQSNFVLGEGDITLKYSTSAMLGVLDWLKKNWKWKKFIILLPQGDPGTRFQAGFYSKWFGICKVSSIVRKVSDGPFAMRMGPKDCYFFIIGTEIVGLLSGGYVRNDVDLY